MPEKPPNPIPPPLDAFQALVQQIGGMQPLQGHMPSPAMPGGMQPSGMPGPSLPNPGLPATLSSDLPGLQGPPLPGAGMPLGNLPGLPPHLRVAGVMPGGMPAKPAPMGGPVDPLAANDSDPIKNLLRQLHQNQKQQQTQVSRNGLWAEEICYWFSCVVAGFPVAAEPVSCAAFAASMATATWRSDIDVGPPKSTDADRDAS